MLHLPTDWLILSHNLVLNLFTSLIGIVLFLQFLFLFHDGFVSFLFFYPSIFFLHETESHYVLKAVLRVMILLCQPPKYWDNKYALSTHGSKFPFLVHSYSSTVSLTIFLLFFSILESSTSLHKVGEMCGYEI